MANLTIKDLPDEVHAAIKETARAQGRSLNSYIVSLLTQDAEERARRKRMRDSRAAFRSFAQSLPRLKDSTGLIREDRERNH